MADTTKFQDEMDRTDVAAYLRELADQFDSASETDATIPLGNKQVVLHPNETVSCAARVTERSSLLGGATEELSLTLSWTPDEGD